MDNIFALLSQITTDPTYQRWILIGVFGLSLFTLTMIVIVAVSSRSDKSERRIRDFMRRSKNVESTSDSAFSGFIARIAPAFVTKDVKEASKVRVGLLQAGFRSPNAVTMYYLLKVLLAIVVPGIALLVAQMIPGLEMSGTDLLNVGVFFLGIGTFIPNWYLGNRKAARQLAIRRGFADSLDMLVVCMEAGLGFDMALRRIAKEIGTVHPIVSEEFTMINAEINAGVERAQALKNFSNRTGLDEIKGFVALLTQCIKLGSSLGSALRIYSDDFRDKRMQNAEEQAAKVGTKLIFPLVFCFFPCFFIVSIGPIVIRAIETFGK